VDNWLSRQQVNIAKGIFRSISLFGTCDHRGDDGFKRSSGRNAREVEAMKNLVVSVMAIGMASSFVGCAADSNNPADPAEGTVSSNVWENSDNYVLSCTPLALRSCDNPGACDTGVRLAYRSIVHVGQVDWNTRMAHLTVPEGWARADGATGEPYLSRDLTPTCQ
jgi:hypothetical protein